MRRKDVVESPISQGRNQYIRFLDGERLTQKQAILAKCFECCNGFIDGREDCEMSDCSLYPLMTYNPNKISSIAPSTNPTA